MKMERDWHLIGERSTWRAAFDTAYTLASSCETSEWFLFRVRLTLGGRWIIEKMDEREMRATA